VRPENRTDFAEPGEKALVSVQTAPNSFVGMLAMDQSLLLLRTGNDITESDVSGVLLRRVRFFRDRELCVEVPRVFDARDRKYIYRQLQLPDRQTDRQACKQTGRQADMQTYI